MSGQRSSLHPESTCNVARSFCSLAQVSEGPPVSFLRRRAPIETNAKEALIRRFDCLRGCAVHVLQGDWRRLGHVPHLISPLLEEVRIAFRHGDKPGDVGRIEKDVHVASRPRDGLARIFFSQRANGRMVEEPLCI